MPLLFHKKIMKAIGSGYKALFSTALTLIEGLDLAEAARQLKKKINRLLKFDILIIDKLDYLPLAQKSVYNFF
jgi:DNA replication protein DnaC